MEMIEKLFGKDFKILTSRESVFEGTLPVFPKALFTVMKKSADN